MRARLAIAASEQPVILREILLRDKAPEFLESSPKGTVPVLILSDGTVVEESYDVMNWAEALNGSDNLLTIGGEAAKALVRRCDEEFKPWLDRFKYPNRYEDSSRQDAIGNAGVFLDELESLLSNQPFLFGSQRGFADIGIAPFIRQFAHVDKAWFLEQRWTNVIRWYQEFIEWDGFLAIMAKYPKWETGQPETIFPTEPKHKMHKVDHD